MSKFKIMYFKPSAENMLLGALGKLTVEPDNFEYVNTIEAKSIDDVFMKMQRLDENNEITNYYREPVRSMCSGDVVVDVNLNMAYQCMPSGWRKLHDLA